MNQDIYIICTRCSWVSQGHAILFIQYAPCTAHLNMYKVQQGITGACNSFYTGYMAWCTMHVAGYHRGMQGNFLAVVGQEMSHAPTPKQPICNVFMDLQYCTHSYTSKRWQLLFWQHICTKAQGNLHKTHYGKAQHKLHLHHNINVCTIWLNYNVIIIWTWHLNTQFLVRV